MQAHRGESELSNYTSLLKLSRCRKNKKETKASFCFYLTKVFGYLPTKTFEFSICIGTKFTEGNSCHNLSADTK